MKETLKKFIGPENRVKISKFRKLVSVSTNRFMRSLLNASETFPALPVRTFALLDAHVFFGYYDVPQFSFDENLLLATVAPLINQTPTPANIMRLGYFDMREEKPKFHEFGVTSTWCWQQGCRLQWYPSNGRETVIYNTMIDGRYGCVVQNVISGEIIESFQRPVYAVSRDGKLGLSLNFSRLQRLRPGYGYPGLPDDTENEPAPVSDGVWRIDMETSKEKLLFSVSDIVDMSRSNAKDSVQHYFNHLLFNPAGDRFIFFHIWQTPDGVRKINMLTSDINGENIYMLNDSGHSSHYAWRDDNHLLCYSTVPGQGEGYYIYRDQSGKIQRVGGETLKKDGHPSYLSGRRYLVTDTYPDKYGEQALFLYNCETKNLIVLDKEFSPVKFNADTRCDLHPRVSPSGKFLCIDCIVENKRAMKVFDISSMTDTVKLS